jgi:hypothetical protein
MIKKQRAGSVSSLPLIAIRKVRNRPTRSEVVVTIDTLASTRVERVVDHHSSHLEGSNARWLLRLNHAE